MESFSVSVFNALGDINMKIIFMTKFQRLKNSELDTKLLIAPPFSDLPLRLGHTVTGELAVSRFAGILLSSIEALELIAYGGYKRLESLKALLIDFETDKD